MSAEVKELVERYVPEFPIRYCGRIFTDTTQFMDISYGDVIALEDQHYLVLKDESEKRFGMEDPKYWVKRCRCMETGQRKILKLVFHESFPIKVGDYEVICHRSPEKEARILNLVRNDTRFMQGRSILDAKNNIVRILDVIRGKRLDEMVHDLEADHETYFHKYLPSILQNFIHACEAIGFLHSNWEKHGDIRRDHLLVEHGSGRYRWIDFDYTFDFHENPFGLDIFGLGNSLIYLIGKGTWTYKRLLDSDFPASVSDAITEDDFSLMQHNRIVNLRKLFPYVPEQLNWVLLHFSKGTEIFYDSVEELLTDLRASTKYLP